MNTNERVLVIGDLHFPYHHRDTFAFLDALKRRFKPTRVIQIGDETDQHAISYHEHDPDLMGPGDEFNAAAKLLQQLEQLFPRLDLLESNHGSLVVRKRVTAGLPARVVKSYNDIWEVGPGWKWHFDMRIKLSNGEWCYLHHGKSANIMRVSQAYGMSSIAGHYHELCGVQYWGTPNALHFGAQTGCLIDWDSMAMAYAKNNLKRPVLGSLIILNGHAIVVPMVLNAAGRWIGKLSL